MYVDSCVLTKLFIREPDSAQCAALLANSFIVSSEMAQTELASALLRKEREGNLSRTQRELAWADFERQIQDESIRLVRLDGPVVRHATALMIRVHPQVPLRTLDAIHLASYLSVIAGPLFTTDRRMQAAARLLEIPLVTPPSKKASLAEFDALCSSDKKWDRMVERDFSPKE